MCKLKQVFGICVLMAITACSTDNGSSKPDKSLTKGHKKVLDDAKQLENVMLEADKKRREELGQ